MNEAKTQVVPAEADVETVARWEVLDLTDHWDNLEPADFEIAERARLRHRITLEPEIFERANRLAQARSIDVESLIQSLLEQGIRDLEGAA